MSLIALPYPAFQPATKIASAQTNANNAEIVAIINGGLDWENIGTAGIFASQIIPIDGPSASFGGSEIYTFPAGVDAGGPLSGVTTLAMTGALTATEIEFANATNAVGMSWLDSASDAADLIFGATDGIGGVFEIEDNGNVLMGLGGTGLLRLIANAANQGEIGLGTVAAGVIADWNLSQPGFVALTKYLAGAASNFGTGGLTVTKGALNASSNASAQAYVPPIYTTAGVALASTTHGVVGAAAVSILNDSVDGSVSIPLSGAAQFASTPYLVAVIASTNPTISTGPGAAGLILSTVSSTTALNFWLTTANGAANNSGSTQTFDVYFIALGS